VRRGLAAAAIGAVLALSALDLALGLLWVVAVLGVTLLRRRHRALPIVVLAGLIALGVLAGAERLGAPAPRRYADDLVARLAGRDGAAPAPAALEDPVDALRRHLAGVRQLELDPDPAELARRAGQAVAAAREAATLRSAAPRESLALEQAARRLALTLTSPEFRDLDGRRARLGAWLDAVQARLTPGGPAAIPDGEALREAAGALEPAVLTPLTFGALRADLAEAERAMTALVGAVAGSPPVVQPEVRIAIDDAGPVQVTVEQRLAVSAGGPARLAWVEVGGLRGSGAPSIEVEADGRPLAVTGTRVSLPPGTREAAVVIRRRDDGGAAPLRTRLRPLAFHEVSVALPAPSPLVAGVAVPAAGPALVLPIGLVVAQPPRVVVEAPGWALAHAGAPGDLTAGPGGDRWTSTGPGPDVLAIELAPRGWLLRNRFLAWLRPHVYGPSVATLLAVAGLGALVVALVPAAPRPVPPP
jgi:hypothetical protein